MELQEIAEGSGKEDIESSKPRLRIIMRIFYAVDQTPNAGIFGSRLWYHNLYLPLVDIGNEVIPLDYDLSLYLQNLDPAFPNQKEFIRENRPKLEHALLRQIQKAHREKPIDLFFSYFYSACCRPEIIDEIRSMGIITMNWYCNASYQFHLVSEIAPAYDYCLVPEKLRLEDYRRIGANPIYCQEAANPNIYKPYSLPQEYDVTFVGQKYGDRPEYIRHLLDRGIDVRLWGTGWRPEPIGPSSKKDVSIWRKLAKLRTFYGWKMAGQELNRYVSRYLSRQQDDFQIPLEICGSPLSDEDLVKMYSRSRISLGFSSCGETHRSKERILQVRLREFEAPMSGAFYVVEYMEELEEFFEVGKEVVCYQDKNDLAEKVQYYLKHSSEREKIRQAGYRRARSEHTWQKRFKKVFREIGLG